MNEKDFSMRLSILRENKKISARKMSQDLGLNPGYINKLETKQVLPSMQIFFQICSYLDILPKDFFDTEVKYPEEMKKVVSDLQKLDEKQFTHIAAVISDLADNHS